MPHLTRRPWTATFSLCLLLVCLSALNAAPNPTLPVNAKGRKAIVLLFVAVDCPISNSYAPEIKRICAHYTPKKIAFCLVYPDPDTSLAAAKKHAKDYGYTCPLVLDPTHRLARKAGATVTPEAAVFAPDGRRIYRGRIDNMFAGYGQRRYLVTAHELRDALEAIVSGKPVRTPETQAVGCFI